MTRRHYSMERDYMFEKDRPCDRVAGRGDSSWPTFWLSHLSGSVTCVNELGVSLTEPVIVVTTSLLNPLTLFFFPSPCLV
jgi:hypothetical protein